MLRALFLASVLSFAAVPVAADTYDDAVKAYWRGEYQTAVQLLRSLSEQGHAEAQFSLGSIYDQGNGVPQNYAEALKWYRMAAEQGHPGAQVNLGVMYSNGKGVPQNWDEAVKWVRRAAEQGDVGAQWYLGFTYSDGRGAPHDYVIAHMWYSLAAAQGHKEAKYARDRLESGMGPEQIAEAQRLAREWKPK